MQLLWKFTRANSLAKFAVVPLLSPMLMFYDSPCSFLEVGKHFYVVPPSVTNFRHKATCDRSNVTVQRHFSLDYSPRFVPLFLFLFLSFHFSPSFPTLCDTTGNVEYSWHMKIRLRVRQTFTPAMKLPLVHVPNILLPSISHKFMNSFKDLLKYIVTKKETKKISWKI